MRYSKNKEFRPGNNFKRRNYRVRRHQLELSDESLRKLKKAAATVLGNVWTGDDDDGPEPLDVTEDGAYFDPSKTRVSIDEVIVYNPGDSDKSEFESIEILTC